MCGICGYINRETAKKADLSLLKRMSQTLYSRGPDDEGFFCHKNIGLGFRRLSIIDLKTGNQPIFNEDKSIAVIFNGEIYNYKELRKGLEKKHRFYTNTDTEVLVHLYEEYKDEMPKHLNGMFSFAIWDANKSILFCARDRMGQKPFYYFMRDGLFAFASEPKALLKHPGIQKELDGESFRQYLLYEYVPAPRSIFKGIKKLPAAYFLKIDRNFNLHVDEYWHHNFSKHDSSKDNIKDQERFYSKRIIELLRKSVQRRLVSDVPLGAFLSGGIDSSLIVSIMADFIPTKSIKTFSIGFHEKSFDERKYSSQVSTSFSTDHRHKVLDPDMMLKIIPEIFSYVDEPFADASIIPTYLLSKFTREHVTVALGGDGGDELFCGYDTFLAHKIMILYTRFPEMFKKVVSKIAYSMPASYSNMSIDFKLKRFLSSASEKNLGKRNALWIGAFSHNEQNDLLAENWPKVGESLYEDIDLLMDKMSGFDDMSQLIYIYIKQYFQDDILTKIDRASMATSLEARSPFLDVEFMEFVNSIPSHLKLKFFTTKYILKKASRGRLPRNIINRTKKGFGVPVGQWFRSDLKEALLEVFSKENIEKQGIFKYNYIQNLLDQHLIGEKDNRKQLWCLFAFEMWYKNCFLES